MYVCMHACMHAFMEGWKDGWTDGCMYGLGSRPPLPPPWYPPPPSGPRLPGPCSQRSRTTGTNPRKPEGGRTMENDPSRCFFAGAENRIRAGTGALLARRKEQHHILYGNEHVTMTLLLTSGSNHTISVEHTQTGRGQPKRPQAPPHRGGRGQGM